MVTRPEVVVAEATQNRDRPDDGANRLGTPTALQLLNPLDAIALPIASCHATTTTTRQEEEEEEVAAVRRQRNLRLLIRARGGTDGDIQMPPSIGRDIPTPATYWATSDPRIFP
jgi:hypothetical protein